MLMLTSNLVITMCIVELVKPTFISGLIGIQIDLGSYLVGGMLCNTCIHTFHQILLRIFSGFGYVVI